MPKQASRPLVIHGLIALCGIVAVYLLSDGVRRHVSLLTWHMAKSGNWSVEGTSESIDRRLVARYAGRERQWRVSYAGAGASQFDLADPGRRRTFSTLGQASIADESLLTLRDSGLVTSYQSLIDRAKGDPAVDQQRLARARVELLSLRRPRTPGLEAYPVLTLPPTDSLAPWYRSAITLEQSGRCRATIVELGAAIPTDRTYVAIATVMPRVLEVSIRRPWIDETILDQASASHDREVREMFSPGSPLSLIPASVWVSLPEYVRVKFDSRKEAAAADALVNSGRCCKVVCETDSFEVDPKSVDVRGDSEFFATRGGVPPTLYAVISKRRGQRGSGNGE